MVRPAHGLPTGTDVSRFLMGLYARHKDMGASNVIIRDGWRDTPQVAVAFALQGKASVSAANTQDGQWAGALADAGIVPTALTVVRGFSIDQIDPILDDHKVIC